MTDIMAHHVITECTIAKVCKIIHSNALILLRCRRGNNVGEAL